MKKFLFMLCLLMGYATLHAATATVNGIEWTYTISNGKANVGSGSWSSPGVPTSTSGVITIPSTLGGYPVTTIGDYAFYYCSSLTSVTIPSSVTTIGKGAFYECGRLTSVTIPKGVTSIGESAFGYCRGLTSVTIPEGVTTIGKYAFENCYSLTSVTIPEDVTSIGDWAFYDCYSLTSVTIPSSVTTIGEGAFSGCDSLTSIYFEGKPPSVGSGVFYGVSATGYYLPKSALAWASVIDSEGKWNGLMMTMGRSTSSLPTYRVPIPHPAATFTATAVGEEQVTLKVTATKGYVFAGWHMDEEFKEACDSTLADYRDPTYTYNVDAENLNFNAGFVKIDEDVRLDLLETKSITPKGNDQRAIQLVINSYSLPKVSVKGLPAGMKFTDKPVMKKGSKTEVEYPINTIYGTPTKPGIYTVTVSLTNSTIKKAITKTFEVNVLNFTDDLIQIADLYELDTPGVSYTVPIDGATGCTVTGLPAGMKWTAKDIYKKGSKTEVETRANSVYGIPTTPGNYTVYFTKTVDKVKHTATATFIVGPYPQLNVMVSDGGVGGKVTGAGGFAANKKVTLKATPNKGYVFAGWYKDALFETPCDSTLVDYRTPNYTYVMGNEDTQFYARFVTKEDEAEYKMGIALYPLDTPTLEIDELVYKAGEAILPIWVMVDSLTLPKVTVKGLPKGMKFDAKTFTISGMPTQPGDYVVYIEAVNASKSCTAVAEVYFTITHYDAHGLHQDEEKVLMVAAFEAGEIVLDENFSDLLNSVSVKSFKLPSGLSYDPKTNTIKGNGTLKSGSYTVTLTDKAGQVTTFTLVAELSEADMFDYNNYLPLNPRQGAVQGVNTGLGWMTIFSATDYARFFSDAEIAKAISVTVSGLPSGLKAELYKTPAGPQLYVCELFLVGKTSVAPGDYPVTVTISNSRTGQVEYVSSWIRIYPPPSIHMNQELTFTAHDFYDKNGEPREAHAEVYHTINGTSGTATYTMTIEPPISQSTAKPILKSGTLPIYDVVVDEYSSTGLLSYHYRYTKTPRITPEIDIWLETDDGVTFKVVSGNFYESEGRNYFYLDEQWIHHPID